MRQEFTKKQKLEAFVRSGGHCEKCTARLGPGNVEYHHERECTFGGGNGGANCIVLCRVCHGGITSARAAVIAKSTRVRAKHINIARQGPPMLGSKRSGWKKTFQHGWVRR